eukprot:TRINITY_DN8651_c0_g1_i1.p1 TRINITY_DN8651_c0_g1~~TRINITY_DN8651_c0_g1_i1.p1  ORF type:complete len:125 (+),score=47.16 TRINITY_DN8651_c0_g1_i1:41-415(+)
MSNDKKEQPNEKDPIIKLQVQYNNNINLFKQVRAKEDISHREKTVNKMVLQELKDLPEGTNAYFSVGKMFLLAPTKNLIDETDKSISNAEENIQKLSKQKEYLLNQIKNNENQLKEMFLNQYQK